MLKSWSKFQHYHKPNPPWIKLYTSLLDDFEFQELSEPSRLLALHILMLAAKTNNKMPKSKQWLKSRLCLSDVDLDPLYAYGLIQNYDPRAASLDSRVYAKETEERQKERKKDGPKGLHPEAERAREKYLSANSLAKVPR